MYVVYDEITMPEGITERRLVTYWTPSPDIGQVATENIPGCQPVAAVLDWLRPELRRALVAADLAPDEDAFCLADG